MSLYGGIIYIQDFETAAVYSVGLGQLAGEEILTTGEIGTICSFFMDMLLHYNQTDHADTI